MITLKNNFTLALGLFFSFNLTLTFTALSQITEATYDRASYFLSNSIQKEVYHLEVIPTWLEGEKLFVHSAFTEKGKRFFYKNVLIQLTGYAHLY